MSGTLKVSTEGAVRILVNCNPQARNALSPELYEALPRALQEAAADPTIGAIVLTGEGGFFSAGGDLRRLARAHELAPEARRANIEKLHGLIRAIRNCPKPVIAAVEGGAAGAGASLALACDMLVASRDAFFSVAYVKVGLTPDGGVTAFLAQSMPRQLMTELCLSGDRLPAERLHALGVVNRLTEPWRALDEALILVGGIARGPARAMARIKQLCANAYGASVAEQLDLEADLMVVSQGDEEAIEGIAAFFRK
ncbi:oxepin-CoA hydrolase, alternative type [Pseudoduganella sp. UC29_106]|uniref:oxepin-CoA hydrolase, alternative type n=1 Tax=Pseudoduganella sp. UC29_106 TaxID=3374553 RepID=UPI003757EC80